MKPRKCDEDGKEFVPTKPEQRFCCAACRKAFNNRAMTRGAALYHLFRAHRRERERSGEMGLWSKLCELELVWHNEDHDAGRKGYTDPQTVLMELYDSGRLARGELMVGDWVGPNVGKPLSPTYRGRRGKREVMPS
jgi:hypothetical protein